MFALAGVAALTLAGAANAAQPIVTSSGQITYSQDLATTSNAAVVWDFDSIARTSEGFNFTAGAPGHVFSGSDSNNAAPPSDSTNYFSVLGSGTGTLTSTVGLKAISFFMGSPDDYNSIEFIGDNGYDVTLSGIQLAGGVNYGGDQSKGLRMNYDFGNDRVHTVIFSSSQNSFEFDRIAAAVPEPTSWALMIIGFGAVGGLARTQRRRPSLAMAVA
jgi:hypothetical protein